MRAAGLAVLLIAAALLVSAGWGGLFEPTETRYAEIARAMRAGGDWRVPRLNGIAHFHKPPLAYWAAAGGMGVLGEDAAGARVPAVLAGVVMLAGTAVAVRRRFPTLAGAPATAVWLLGSAVLFVATARSLAADPFLGAGVALFWAAAPSPWALAGIGLGFLAKGPVVLVHTVLPVLVAAAWGRDRATLRLLGPPAGWLVAAAIALPWFVWAVATTPGLARYFLVDQLWERYATTRHQRGGPAWYFAAVWVAGLLPWTPLVIAGIARAWRGSGGARPAEGRLALAWLLAPTLVFSFAGSKLPAYLLPCAPAAALLAAHGAGSRAARRACALLLAVVVIVGAAFGPWGLARLIALDPGRPIPLPPAAWVALAALAAAGALAWRGALPGAAALVLAGWVALLAGLARYEGPLGSLRPAVRLLAAQARPREPVIEVAEFHAGIPFHLGRSVMLLDVPRELGFDPAGQRARVMVTADSLAPLVERHGRAWLVGPEREVRALAAGQQLRFTVLTHWRRRLVIGFVSR